jgi:hypothetical protein
MTDIQKDEAPAPPHPRCAACGVPMWLIRVQRHPLDPAKDKRHYECQACGSKAVLPHVN